MSKLEEDFAFQLKLAGYCQKTQFVREAMAMPPRKWRFDFAFPACMVYVEVEGLTHGKGRHQTFKGYSDDCDKYNAATLQGWIGLRFTQRHVKSLEGIKTLTTLLNQLNFKPKNTPKL